MTRVWREQSKLINRLLDETPIHRGQPPLLLALLDDDGRTQSELAEWLAVSPATVTNMVKRMENSGLVTRQRDTQDERVSRVYLTGEGRQFAEEMVIVTRQIEATTFARFTEADKTEFKRLLHLMLEGLEEAST